VSLFLKQQKRKNTETEKEQTLKTEKKKSMFVRSRTKVRKQVSAFFVKSEKERKGNSKSQQS
jgi:hypothetical protein